MEKWKVYKIGELVDLSQGQVINAQTNHLVVKEGIPLLRITDMLNGRQNIFIDAEKVGIKNMATPEDIIYTRTGQVGLVFKNQKGVVHNNCFKVIPKDQRLDRNYLYWVLKDNSIYEYVNGVASGSAQPDLPHGAFKSITINLPPLSIQLTIASILNSYDELINVNNQRIKLLEETARELYKEWFVRMRFPGYKQARFVKGIPEGWEIKKLDQVIELAYGKALKEENRKEGTFLVYGSSGIVGTHDSYIVKAPGIVVGRKGNVGSIFWVTKNFHPIDTAFYVKTKISMCYVFFNLQFQHFIEGDAAVPGLNRNQAYSNYILVPSKDLLKQFDEIIIPNFELQDLLSNQNTQLRQIRDRLLPRLISGKLELKNVNQTSKVKPLQTVD
jgi:type I restriction enzyme S subunit